MFWPRKEVKSTKPKMKLKCMLYTPTGEVGSFSISSLILAMMCSAMVEAWSGTWYLAWTYRHCNVKLHSCNLRIITSGVDISTRVFLTYSSPSSPVYSCLLMVALAAHPWEFLEAQVYHQVLRSLEELFLVNLKHSWVIKTPSFELFPEFYK